MQSRLRPGICAPCRDAGIQQLGQRRTERKHVRPRRLGARRPRGVLRSLRLVGMIGHRRNMASQSGRGKGASRAAAMDSDQAGPIMWESDHRGGE